jgi:hypothetical protein
MQAAANLHHHLRRRNFMRKILIVFSMLSLLLCFSTTTLADLVLADGKPTGQWYDPNRNGEGFYVEIIHTGTSNNQIGVAMYSFDADGNQLWVVGNIGIAPAAESARIPVFQFNGPVWGPGFDPGDLNTIEFGYITVRFPTCDSALFQVETNEGVGLESDSYSLVRLTEVVGVECTDPPPEQSFPAGKWDGDGVCFNVAQDGRSITDVGSSCANGAAAWTNLNGVAEDTGDCNVEISCPGIAGGWPIEEGKFACVNNEGDLIVGQFGSSNSASGFGYKERGGIDDYCVAHWTASP